MSSGSTSIRATLQRAIDLVVLAGSLLKQGLRELLAQVGWLAKVGWQATADLVTATLRSGGNLPTERLRNLLAGPVTRVVFGRRLDVSAAVLAAAPLLSLTANYWAAQVGYVSIRGWVRGTWSGTEPHLMIFAAVGALVALAAATAAVNSGLVPTALLVAAPVFGVAFARYGLTLGSSGTVGIPNATTVACLLAAGLGLPLALTGFTLGVAGRRLWRLLGSASAQSGA